MKIRFLQARNGDAILLNFKDEQNNPLNILIDGGTSAAYFDRAYNLPGPLKIEVDKLKENGESIDLLILTHIDDDHIGGLLDWFKKDADAPKTIKKIWFNSGKLIAEYLEAAENEELKIEFLPETSLDTSINQGKDFEQFIHEQKIWDRKIIAAPDRINTMCLQFDILSPNKKKLEKLLKEWKKKGLEVDTAGKEHDYRKSIADHITTDRFKEDTAFPNGSSIAFLLTHKNKKMLFLGDAHPSVIAESLRALGYSLENKLEVDFVKVSHHGSSSNTSPDLLDLIDTKNYIISTSGEVHNHPNKQLLARIINHCNNCTLYFNYPERIDVIFSETDYKDFPDFRAVPVNDGFIL